MLTVEILKSIEEYNLKPLRSSLDDYLKTYLYEISNHENCSFITSFSDFNENMTQLYELFTCDAIIKMNSNMNTGTLLERRKARNKMLTVRQLIYSIIPDYFNFTHLALLAVQCARNFNSSTILQIMKVVESLPSDLSPDDVKDYFEDWICDTYLEDCCDYDSTYRPFITYKRNYKNCFIVWIFRNFEDIISDWFENEFYKRYDEFKTSHPKLVDRFWESIY